MAHTDDDLDSWRDDLAFITPSGARQWLALPVAYLAIGALVITALLLIAHGRPWSPQSWILVSGAALFIVWGFVFAAIGRRAWDLHEIEVSQRYVRIRTIGASCLCILATLAGIVAGSDVIPIVGFATLWSLRSRSLRLAEVPDASDFRIALADILRWAFLVEGVLMAATSLACGLVALLALREEPRLASQYIGEGIVLVLIGCLTTVMAVQQLPRRASSR